MRDPDRGPTSADSTVEIPQTLKTQDRGAKVLALRQLFAAGEVVLLPGVTNALLARLVEQHGFSACYATGAGIANFDYALPDIGIIGGDEMAGQIARIADATTLPVVADADDGYGGPAAVVRTVHRLERAGVAGLQLEDQAAPKRCGHFVGKTLVTQEEMVAKIRAATSSRTRDTVIIARTDAVAVAGLPVALTRARAYLHAGADALFIEAPVDVEQLRTIGREFRSVPLIVNVVDGGMTPSLPVEAYADMGFNIILYANLLMVALIYSAEAILGELRASGDHTLVRAERTAWSRRQALVQLDAFDRLEDTLRS